MRHGRSLACDTTREAQSKTKQKVGGTSRSPVCTCTEHLYLPHYLHNQCNVMYQQWNANHHAQLYEAWLHLSACCFWFYTSLCKFSVKALIVSFSDIAAQKKL